VDVADGAAFDVKGLPTLATPPGLEALARQAQQAVIVFTDVTRRGPDRALAERALADLEAAGFPL